MPKARRFAKPLLSPDTSIADLAAQPSLLVRAFQAGETLAPPPAPTPRELEVITLLADDLDTEEIAERMVISLYTVRSHIEKMRLKYQKRSMLGIVVLALRQGWIT